MEPVIDMQRYELDHPLPRRATPATLKRVAWAKMLAVDFFTATFDGVDGLFAPWFRVLLDRVDSLWLTSLYLRTSTDGHGPSLCVRRAEWHRERDMAHAQEADNLADYLTTGTQLDHDLIFGTEHGLSDIMTATRRMVGTLATGSRISPITPRPAPWCEVQVEVVDPALTTRFGYSPQAQQCAALEYALPGWLAAAEDTVHHRSVMPDRPVRLTLHRLPPKPASAPLALLRTTQ
ncbi:hypothetical protein GCM10023222_39710 [Saccharopolyspora cebuensis]